MISVLRWIAAIGFVLIGTITLGDWLRTRNRIRGIIATSVGFLGLVVILSQVLTAAPVQRLLYTIPWVGAVSTDVLLISLALSGLGFYLFRTALFPAHAMTNRIVGGMVGLSILGTIATPIPIGQNMDSIGFAPFIAVLYTIILWIVLVAATVVHLWMKSYGLPSVQRSRLRSLAIGYGLLVAILVVALVGGTVLSVNFLNEALRELLIIAFVPCVYTCLYPPKKLRILWRLGEEEDFARELNDLVRLTPTPQQLAERSVEWAANLVGAEGCAFLDSTGEVIATYNMTADQARALGQLDTNSGASNRHPVIRIPIHLGEAPGYMVMETGPITPEFGQDEILRLELYTLNLGAAYSRVKLIEHLRQTQEEAVAANKAKSAFLSHMSHELRTPLGAILGFSEVLTDGLEGPLTAAQHDDVERIHSSGKHLLSLLDQVLDLSRIEAGRMELFPIDISLDSLITKTMQTLGSLVKKDVFTLTYHGEVDYLVYVDPQKVRQVVYNLLNNAIKFTDRGSVTVTTRLGENGMVIVDVADTGIGIATDDITMVFNEFQQAQPSNTHPRGGSGLGLAICKSIVELHGGKIWCTSALGVGSTFSFTLPLADPSKVTRVRPLPKQQSPTTVNGNHRRRSNEVVVVIDGNPKTRSYVAKQLKLEGLQCIEAANVPEVMEITETIRPVAITMNINGSVKDELQVFRELTTWPWAKDIPVVLTSTTEFGQVAFPLEHVSFLQKPLMKKQLLDAIKDVLPLGYRRRILVVDDDPAVQRFVVRALGREEVIVHVAMNGQDGIDLAITQRPDLIIADLIMPEMSGFEMIARLRTAEATTSIPIMVVSAKELDVDDITLLNKLIETFTSRKDFVAVDLASTLRSHIDNFREPLLPGRHPQ